MQRCGLPRGESESIRRIHCEWKESRYRAERLLDGTEPLAGKVVKPVQGNALIASCEARGAFFRADGARAMLEVELDYWHERLWQFVIDHREVRFSDPYRAAIIHQQAQDANEQVERLTWAVRAFAQERTST